MRCCRGQQIECCLGKFNRSTHKFCKTAYKVLYMLKHGQTLQQLGGITCEKSCNNSRVLQTNGLVTVTTSMAHVCGSHVSSRVASIEALACMRRMPAAAPCPGALSKPLGSHKRPAKYVTVSQRPSQRAFATAGGIRGVSLPACNRSLRISVVVWLASPITQNSCTWCSLK